MKSYKIPEATIMRLSIYIRFLGQLIDEGISTISSRDIARGAAVSAAQVRKDLAYFGAFGTRGVGYQVDELHETLRQILGQDSQWNVMIVGAGRLGWALACYPGFINKGFNVCAVVDTDPQLIGKQVGGNCVSDSNEMETLIRSKDISIALITVPANKAQKVTNRLVEAGVPAILNFAPCVLHVPHGVLLRNVDFTINMEVLSYNLTNR